MTLYLKNEDWRLIAEQVSTEMDPAKLTLLVAQLCDALDAREKSPQWATSVGTPSKESKQYFLNPQ